MSAVTRLLLATALVLPLWAGYALLAR